MAHHVRPSILAALSLTVLAFVAVLLGTGDRTAIAGPVDQAIGIESLASYSTMSQTVPITYTNYLSTTPTTYTSTMQVFYPASLANGAALPPTQTFPVVVFMQGGNVDQSRYQYLQNIAAKGYVVALPNALAAPIPPFIPFPFQIATTELLDRAVKLMKGSIGNPTYAFSSVVSSTFAIGGHSQGSIPVFASIAPAVICPSPGANAACPPGYVPDPAIRASFTFGGSFLNAAFVPGQRSRILPVQDPITVTNQIPLFMIGGEYDGLGTTNVVGQRLTLWRLFNLASKRLWILPGGNHFGFANGPLPSDTSAPQDYPAKISVEGQNELAVQAVVTYLDCTLKGLNYQCEALDRSFTSNATPFNLGLPVAADASTTVAP